MKSWAHTKLTQFSAEMEEVIAMYTHVATPEWLDLLLRRHAT